MISILYILLLMAPYNIFLSCFGDMTGQDRDDNCTFGFGLYINIMSIIFVRNMHIN